MLQCFEADLPHAGCGPARILNAQLSVHMYIIDSAVSCPDAAWGWWMQAGREELLAGLPQPLPVGTPQSVPNGAAAQPSANGNHTDDEDLYGASAMEGLSPKGVNGPKPLGGGFLPSKPNGLHADRGVTAGQQDVIQEDMTAS